VQGALPANPRQTGKSLREDFARGRFALSDDKATHALIAFLDAAEAGIASARQILTGKGAKTFTWDPNKIKWEEAEGFKGLYERSEDANNLEFKVMLKDLQDHKGSLWRDGYYYWAFQKNPIVGRKKKEQKTKE